MRSSTFHIMSRSVPPHSSTSRSNNNTMLMPPCRLSGVDFVASLHTLYAYFTGLLLTLTGIKYQGSSTNPFSKHPTLMTLFLVPILVYIISLITLRRSNHMSDHSSKLLVGVCHICGAVSCELLLLVLVSPVTSLVINVSSLTPIVMVALCYKYILRRILDAEEEGTGISQSDAGDQASHQMEMVDLEAPA